MLSRVSWLFQVTTNPADTSAAIPHTGGWSEQLWTGNQIPSSSPSIRTVANSRAQLLPREASIVGARIAYYDIEGNKLMPRGSTTVKFSYPGSAGYRTDLPQVSLEMNATTDAGPNASRFRLRCIPDVVMIGGEYQPDSSFKRLVTTYCNLISGVTSLGFIGRNLTNPTARVLSVAGNTVTLDGSISAVVGSSYLRFNRTIDVLGIPIQGTYRIVNFVAPGTYTVVGLDNRTANNSGTARVDALQFFDMNQVNPVRAVIKKVGRPFESYRGRASKRRA